jgi:hypothetical protein
MKKIILLIGTCGLYFMIYGQNLNDLSGFKEFTYSTISQKTASSKDVHSDFLNTSIGNIFGKNNSFSFNPTFYALDSLLNPKARGKNPIEYGKQKILRDIQLIDSFKINNPDNEISKLSFASLTVGLSIVLIDKRNISYADFKNDKTIRNPSASLEEMIKINMNAQKDIVKKIGIIEKTWTAEKIAEYDKTFLGSWGNYQKQHDYNQLDDVTKGIVEQLPEEEKDAIKLSLLHKTYSDMAALYARKPLLTATPSYAYDFTKKQAQYSLLLDYLRGLGTNINKTPWELELKGSFYIGKDTTINVSNLKDQLGTISSGLNKVLAQDAKKQSNFELKGFFEYDHQFGNVPTGSESNKVTFNITLRKKFFNSFWVPLTLSYDITHPNLFGFLSVTVNIDKGSSSTKN